MRLRACKRPTNNTIGLLTKSSGRAGIAWDGRLAAALGARAGIVEHGLFIGLATDLIVAGAGGIQVTARVAP